MIPTEEIPSVNLTVHFASHSFRPLTEDLQEIARMRSSIPHEIGFTSNQFGIQFHDGTSLVFPGRVDPNTGHFRCAPWFLGRDPHTRLPKIYSGGFTL